MEHDLLSFGRLGVYLCFLPSHDQGTMLLATAVVAWWRDPELAKVLGLDDRK